MLLLWVPTVYTEQRSASCGDGSLDPGACFDRTGNIRVRHRVTCGYGKSFLLKAISAEDGLSRDPSGLSLYVSLEIATRLQAENLSKLDSYTLKGIQAPYYP